jgi:phage terminase Nu1 subunit (DNA packaging protein)
MGGAKNQRYQFVCKKRKCRMLKKELADALGISGPMVSKLAKRGMPTDSVERAQRWRKRHLEPGRLKSNKAKGPTPAPPSGAGGPVEMRPAPRPPAQPSPDDEDEFTGPLDGELLFQKTRETKARADKLEMELAELKSALTRADQTRMAVYETSRLLRDDLKHVGRNAAPKVLQATTLHDKQAVIDREIRDAQNIHTENLRQAISKAESQTPAPAAQASPGTQGEFTGPLDGELLFQKTRETKARADKLELELAEAQGILIRAAEVRMGAFTCSRTVRDLLACVGRNAAHKVLQATSLHDCQAVIDREIGAVLDFLDKRLIPDLFKKIAPKLPTDGDTGTT